MRLLQPAEVLEKKAALQAADKSGRILAHKFSKVSADNSGEEPARRDLAGIMAHKWQEHIPGGLAAGKKPSDFPIEDLIKGITVEMEHTNDPAVACEIAMDHLVEKTDYYDKGDMAKEVAESLGKVEDGAITLAKKAGALVAQMYKEAGNPLAAIKGATMPLLGRLAKPIEGAAVKGVVGGAEHTMGKVLPMRGSVSTLESARTMASPGTLRQGQIPSAHTVADPQRGAPVHQLLQGGQAAPQVAARQATKGFDQHPLVGRVEQATRPPGNPTRPLNIPEGRYDPETRRIGADEWLAANPEKASANLRLAKQRDALAAKAKSPATTEPSKTSPGTLGPAPAASPVYDARAQHLLETGEAMPAGAVAPNAPGWSARAHQDISLAKHVTPPIPTSPHTGASMGGNVGFRGGSPGAVTPPAGTPPSVGSVGSPGPSVKRFSMGKALGVGALGAGIYGATKAIPWAANQVADTSSMPLAYGGGWSATPYGYGSTPYGSGVQTMGPGA